MPADSKVKVYKVTALPAEEGGLATLQQYSAGDVIEAGMPVIIESTTTDPAQNKLLPYSYPQPAGAITTALYDNYGNHLHDSYGDTPATKDSIGYFLTPKIKGSIKQPLYKFGINAETGQVGFWDEIPFTSKTVTNYNTANNSNTKGQFQDINGNEAYSTKRCALFEMEKTYEETTLAGLVQEGEEGINYAITDELTAVYETDEFIIAKDDNKYAAKQLPADDELDYMGRSGLDEAEGYDQSNWVKLNKQANELGRQQLEGKLISGVQGKLVNKKNPELNLTNALTVGEPNSDYEIAQMVDHNIVLTDDVNTFVAASFAGTQTGTNGKKYFFVQPKSWEMCDITWAVWDTDRKAFYVPAQEGSTVNGAGLKGHFNVDLRLNTPGNFTVDDIAAGEHVFRALVVSLPDASHPMRQPHRVSPGEGDTSGQWLVYPLNLTSESVVTGVVAVTAQAGVQSVRYVNVAGQVSATPWSGVNIVVTRHTDGTVTTTKSIR